MRRSSDAVFAVLLFALTSSTLHASEMIATQTQRRIVPHDLVLLSNLMITIDSSATGTTAFFTVTGTVTLGGALILNATGAPFPVGHTYLLIANDATDAVIGTFAGLPEGAIIISGGQAFRISYVGGTGNDVVLTAVAASAIPTLGPLALIALAMTIAFAALVVLRRQ